jgi:hypothetical protein
MVHLNANSISVLDQAYIFQPNTSGNVVGLKIIKRSLETVICQDFYELWCNGKGIKIRHGESPCVNNPPCGGVQYHQPNVVAISRRWVRAYRAFARSLGSFAFGLWGVFIAHFKTLISYILNQGMDHFTVQTAVILLGTFYQCCMESVKESKSYFLHSDIVASLWRNSQGLRKAVSAETATGLRAKRESYDTWQKT